MSGRGFPQAAGELHFLLEGKTYMADSTATLPEIIDCPLCLGKGNLSRAEMLERLGMRDFTRVAELSAQEAIRLLLAKEQQDACLYVPGGREG
jgi:hypothetical protein